MLEYFPERRKSSTDLLPLPKAILFRRSPSPAKRSFSDLLTPFQRKSNDDSLYFMDKQEPNPKRQAKLFSVSKFKSTAKLSVEFLNDVVQSRIFSENDNLDSLYSFIDCLPTEMPPEISNRQNENLSTQEQFKLEMSFVLWELVTSEIVYLKQMWFLVRLPVCLLTQMRDQFFPRLEVGSVFGNVLEVLKANVQFWHEFLEPVYQVLRLSGQAPCTDHLVSLGFGNISKIFVPYKIYCMNIASCCEYMSQQENESENFRAFTEWCRTSDYSNRLGLDSFVTMPFQRITRYTLFLERMLKITEPEDQSHSLVQAIIEVEKFVNSINRKVKTKELNAKLLFFQKIITGLPATDEYCRKGYEIPLYPAFSLTCPMQVKEEFETEIRCLIYQETFRLKRIHQKIMLVKLLLFTDLLLIVKPLKKNQQCKLQLISPPLPLNQLILLQNHTNKDCTDPDNVLFLAELNSFNSYFSIAKLYNDKPSQASLGVFYRKFIQAKAHFGIIMRQPGPGVQISVVNSDELSLSKEEEPSSPTAHHNSVFSEPNSAPPVTMTTGNSSIAPAGRDSISCSEALGSEDCISSCDSDDNINVNGPDNNPDSTTTSGASRSLNSNSWIDLEQKLNSCIILDPFFVPFHCPILAATAAGSTNASTAAGTSSTTSSGTYNLAKSPRHNTLGHCSMERGGRSAGRYLPSSDSLPVASGPSSAAVSSSKSEMSWGSVPRRSSLGVKSSSTLLGDEKDELLP